MMKRQIIYLESWNWLVVAFYDCGPDDADEALSALREIGCRGWQLFSARRNLKGIGRNNGVTYTNGRLRQSVMVIGKTSSADEFANSYDHEKGHLVKQIVQCEHMDPFGEEAEYLAGAVGGKSFKAAKGFLCDHCRRHMESFR